MSTNNSKMKRKRIGLGAVLLAVLLIFILTLAPALTDTQAAANVHPTLLAMAAEQPGAQARVLIQKSDVEADVVGLVARMGGTVIHELNLINAVAAEMPVATAVDLAYNASVNWVSLDGAVESAGKPPKKDSVTIETVRDEFNTVSYNNNDGTATWAGNWIELGDNAAATSGNVIVTNNWAQIRVLGNGLFRTSDLSTASGATLTFDFQTGSGVEANEDKAVVEVSDDGGDSYTILETFADYAGGVSGSRSYDITPFISANTTIRFRVSAAYGGPDEFFAIDNVQIEFSSDGAPLPDNTYLDTLGVRQVWDMGYDGSSIGIAVIDSGITNDQDFDTLGRMISFNPDSTTVNDTYGHGTHVAGIIAGTGYNSNGAYQGIAPQATLFGLKISDETGLAYESDTVAALQWVFDNKDTYNIRVVNLSINSTSEQSYHDSPMNAAAEILWFNGIVVVASSGNRSDDWSWDTINTAPANDPFIITVGASNEDGDATRRNDYMALFTANDITSDGFIKPDVIAPGKDIYSVLAGSSSWGDDNPERCVLGCQYFRLSGTSMSTPMVSGAVALLLQAEPNLTPDQVKYRLMNTGDIIYGDFPGADFAYMDVYDLITTPTTESANQDTVPHMLLAKMALIAYWANENGGGENIDWANVDWDAVNWDAVDWDAVDWGSVNWGSVNWGSVNWGSVNWGSVNWGSVNWGSVNWGSVNWGSVNWGSVNWGSVNWGSVSWDD